MKRKIESRGCPVCGFPEFQALDNSRRVTWEICPACSAESGYEYQAETEEEHLFDLRRRWFVERGGAWWSPHQKSPAGWNAREQLQKAGLSVPSL